MDDVFYNPSENPRRKRAHAEMSQATLSPSPMIFRGPATSSFASVPRYNSSTVPNNETFFEHRRTSHPHNPPIHQNPSAADNMPQRSQSQQRPRLEHRTSQTLIDLTEDADEDRVPRTRTPSQVPPQLGRSDAQRLGNIIDLTEDDAEVQITGARPRGLRISGRELPQPRPQPQLRPHGHPPRSESPGLFFPERRMPEVVPPVLVGRYGLQGLREDGLHRLEIHEAIHNPGGVIARFVQQHIQAMPGQMDYQHAAFAQRKPDHIAPLPANAGFTRSPTEKDIVICPSCEEELVHSKEIDELVAKKGGKAPTRKEREEHPFWVIKECGHVYCNTCYQHRATPVAKQPGNVSFRTSPPGGKGGKKPLCAVEGCESDVKNKEKWVGVFL